METTIREVISLPGTVYLGKLAVPDEDTIHATVPRVFDLLTTGDAIRTTA